MLLTLRKSYYRWHKGREALSDDGNDAPLTADDHGLYVTFRRLLESGSARCYRPFAGQFGRQLGCRLRDPFLLIYSYIGLCIHLLLGMSNTGYPDDMCQLHVAFFPLYVYRAGHLRQSHQQ
jgi:hypothetical protein